MFLDRLLGMPDNSLFISALTGVTATAARSLASRPFVDAASAVLEET